MKKIKFILSAFLFVSIIYSCSNENEPVDSNQESVYQLDKIFDFFPSDFLKLSSKAIFKNSNNELKIFELNYEEGTEEQFRGEEKFQTEKLIVDYIDPNDNTYNLNIYLTSKYNNLLDIISNNLFATINTLANNGLTSSIIIDENGNGFQTERIDQITLNNKNFDDVYFDILPVEIEIESFKGIYYNKEFGIIAFYDKEGKLWVFDKFEE